MLTSVWCVCVHLCVGLQLDYVPVMFTVDNQQVVFGDELVVVGTAPQTGRCDELSMGIARCSICNVYAVHLHTLT